MTSLPVASTASLRRLMLRFCFSSLSVSVLHFSGSGGSIGAPSRALAKSTAGGAAIVSEAQTAPTVTPTPAGTARSTTPASDLSRDDAAFALIDDGTLLSALGASWDALEKDYDARSAGEKKALCANMRSPRYSAFLKAQGDRNPRALGYAQKAGALRLAACDFAEGAEPLAEFHALSKEFPSQALAPSLVQPTTILVMLSLTAEARPWNIRKTKLLGFSAWLEYTLARNRFAGVFSPEGCNSAAYESARLPVRASCMADWLTSRVFTVQILKLPADAAETASARARVEKEITGFAPERLRGLREFPLLFSLPFRNGEDEVVRGEHSGSAVIARTFFSGVSPEARARLVTSSGGTLAPMLRLSRDEWKGIVRCEDARDLAARVVPAVTVGKGAKKPSRPLSNESWGLLGHVLFAACDAKAVAAEIARLEKDGAGVGAASAVLGVELSNVRAIVENDSRDDLGLRRDLGLRFVYGAAFDVEDAGQLQNPGQATEALADGWLASGLRAIHPDLPWVFVSENLEDFDIIKGRTPLFVGKAGFAGLSAQDAASLVRGYVDVFDPLPLEPAGSLAVKEFTRGIQQVTNVSRARFAETEPVVFQIHNGLESALVEAWAGIKPNVKPADRKEWEQIHFRILRDLSRYFARTRLGAADRIVLLDAAVAALDDRTLPASDAKALATVRTAIDLLSQEGKRAQVQGKPNDTAAEKAWAASTLSPADEGLRLLVPRAEEKAGSVSPAAQLARGRALVALARIANSASQEVGVSGVSSHATDAPPFSGAGNAFLEDRRLRLQYLVVVQSLRANAPAPLAQARKARLARVKSLTAPFPPIAGAAYIERSAKR